MENPGPSLYISLLLLLCFSAFFSACETAVSSVSRIRLRTRAEDGDAKARTALENVDQYDKTLSAILIGNNVVNLSASSLSTIVATSLLGQGGAAIATVIITVLVLVFGEVLPKSYAKQHAEDLSISIAGPLAFIRILLSPLVFAMTALQRLVLRRPEDDSPSVTEDDLKTIIDTVEEEGVLSSQETDIIHSAIEFDNTTVQDILIPRVDMVAVEVDTPTDELLKTVLDSGCTRIPLYEKDIDHIIGMLHTKDLFACMAQNKPIQARELLRSIPFVYRTKRINELLAELRRTKQQMAIVTDDYGGTVGLVTMEDVLEELVGEIFDETDDVEVPVQCIGENLYRVAGEVSIHDLFDALDFSLKGYESEFSSAAGWALECLERIPQEGDSFDFENLHVTVEKMDEQRILSLLVRVTPTEDESEK